jgi:predicted amidohydrolase
MEAMGLIRQRVRWCEDEGVSILCCPEAVLGGLADYDADPSRFAIDAKQLESVLAPLASDKVTTILGFTEYDDGALFNSAVVFDQGRVAGIYRKQHPAINRSVYGAGTETPVFRVGEVTLGIVICNDSTYVEPVKRMAAQGATLLFVPTNNSLPTARASRDAIAQARKADVAHAVGNGLWVIRADVAGIRGDVASYGASGIVDPCGTVVQSSRELAEDLLIAEVNSGPYCPAEGALRAT